MRIWLACATSWSAVTEFERAVNDVGGGTLQPDQDGYFDERILGF